MPSSPVQNIPSLLMFMYRLIRILEREREREEAGREIRRIRITIKLYNTSILP
jgi:hypothetical protein